MIIKHNEMSINNKDLADFNARLLSYTVGGTEYSQTYNNATTGTGIYPLLFNSNYGLRSISITVVFKANKISKSYQNILHNLIENKTRLDTALLSSELDLLLPDGFYYRVILTKMGDEKIDGHELEITYTFIGIRHEPKVILNLSFGSSTTQNFICRGNAKTGARIIFTPIIDAEFNLYINGIEYKISAENGRNIVIDGIDKQITSGSTVEFINFPALQVGINVIRTSIKAFDIAVVEYYPIWV